ncbi:MULTISPECIES: CPBP family intramembrane glutamic endopeptidase [Streptomyces]|uniref:CPBP family intramembrane glutamic endopeptidase n=1 Tax=Streptomyces TaxID=1883 RepID=UPI001CCBEBC0|nr:MULTISPECIES: type II CAAX endopeptidase family protein [Streptomyces]UBI39107.1 CPBP family intramembrane metalloprotease [Streptomyces mobaraensis]UKW31686.1 CPBP family intramembrane metalloprotease [Streptomyces sp. TYQ1024]
MSRRRGLWLYLGVAYAGMWLAMLPLLVSGYRRGDAREGTGALAEVCIAFAMFAPALGAVVAVRYVRGGGRLREALALRWPRPWGRAVRECLTAVAVPAGLTVAALTLGALVGRYPVVPVGELDAASVTGRLAGGLVGMVVSLPLFFGEELGWQGYLFPRLLRDGHRTRPLRAYLLTGAAFALWHLPTLIMGGQYPGRPWYVSVPAMVVSCTLVLPVFTWLRLRSGSVVPAVVAHAFVSSLSVGMVKEFADPDAALDPLHMGLTGWPGWIVMAAFVAFLARTGRLRPTDGHDRL